MDPGGGEWNNNSKVEVFGYCGRMGLGKAVTGTV